MTRREAISFGFDRVCKPSPSGVIQYFKKKIGGGYFRNQEIDGDWVGWVVNTDLQTRMPDKFRMYIDIFSGKK